MVEIEVAYLGQLRCSAKHGPSGMLLTTDAPVDNKGRGEAFSPTDLVATALGTCMLTLMGIRAGEQGIPLDGTQLSVKKHMVSSPLRRIAQLEVGIRVPHGAEISAAGRAVLEHAARTCPVRLSILEAIEVPLRFDWADPR
ncbi:MAG TPA: OsmC family protein [Polyangiaceae bacterium]|nr:OsmC family protein [Polyangiaceae bacterium]